MKRSIDIEFLIQKILTPYIKTYCRPLPKEYELPNILVVRTGGTQFQDWSGTGHIDRFNIQLYCRAEDDGTAQEALSTAVAILKDSDEFRFVQNNTDLGNWGVDPVRPDLSLFSVSLIVSASLEEIPPFANIEILSDGSRAVEDGYSRLVTANL